MSLGYGERQTLVKIPLLCPWASNPSEPQFSYLYNGEVTLISEFVVRLK